MDRDRMIMEMFHYVLLAFVLLASWIPLMNYWQGDLVRTAGAWFLVLFFADQLLHKYLLDEDFIWEG